MALNDKIPFSLPLLPQAPNTTVNKQFNPILCICDLYAVPTCVKKAINPLL